MGRNHEKKIARKTGKTKTGEKDLCYVFAGAYGHIWRWKCIAGSGREHRGGIGGAPECRKVGFRSGRWGDV